MKWKHLNPKTKTHFVIPDFPGIDADLALAASHSQEKPCEHDISLFEIVQEAVKSDFWKEEFQIQDQETLDHWTGRLLPLEPTTWLDSEDPDDHHSPFAVLVLTTTTLALAQSLENQGREFATAKQKITKLESDLSLERANHTEDNRVAEEANKHLSRELQKYDIVSPEESLKKENDLRQEIHQLRDQITNLTNANRDLAVSLANKMATPPGTNRLSILLPPGNISDVWNKASPFLKYNKDGQPVEMPKTEEDFKNLIVARVMGTDAPPLGCTHPTELSHVLIGPDQPILPWEDALNDVRNLLDEQQRAATAPAPATEGKLFRASDVPEFTDANKYYDFRASLQMFFQSEDAPPTGTYGRALMRVISTFKDPTARAAAHGWDLSTILRHDWPTTWITFLEALDQKFLPATALEDAIADFMRVHPKADETAASFFNRFEAALARRRAMETMKGAARFSDDAVTLRLIAVLPRYLVDDVRLALRRQNRILETQTPALLRPEFETAWAYVQKPAPKTTPTPRARPAPAGRNPNPRPANQVTTRQCGLTVSYDSAPAVPEALRGSLYPSNANPSQNAANLARRQLAAQQQVCEYCRRPRSQHQNLGTNFKPVTMDTAPRNRPAPIAQIEGPRVTDVTNQLALPAPENPAA